MSNWNSAPCLRCVNLLTPVFSSAGKWFRVICLGNIARYIAKKCLLDLWSCSTESPFCARWCKGAVLTVRHWCRPLTTPVGKPSFPRLCKLLQALGNAYRLLLNPLNHDPFVRIGSSYGNTAFKSKLSPGRRCFTPSEPCNFKSSVLRTAPIQSVSIGPSKPMITRPTRKKMNDGRSSKATKRQLLSFISLCFHENYMWMNASIRTVLRLCWYFPDALHGFPLAVTRKYQGHNFA